MRILVLADIDELHWPAGGGEADLLLSCGDLFDQVIVEAAQAYHCPQVFAVKGNHDQDRPFASPIEDLHLRVCNYRAGAAEAGGAWAPASKQRDQARPDPDRGRPWAQAAGDLNWRAAIRSLLTDKRPACSRSDPRRNTFADSGAPIQAGGRCRKGAPYAPRHIRLVSCFARVVWC